MMKGCRMGETGASVGKSSSGSSSSSIVLCKVNWTNAEDVNSAWLGCLDQKSKNPRHLVQNSDKIRTVGVALFVLATRGPKPVSTASSLRKSTCEQSAQDGRYSDLWLTKYAMLSPVLYEQSQSPTRVDRGYGHVKLGQDRVRICDMKY